MLTRYDSGEYLKATGGTWHLEDSPFKAGQVLRMVQRHKSSPRSIIEIGCGAGGVLAELRAHLPDASLTGYEISPQAHAISQKFEAENLRFICGDAFADNQTADLVLVLDVVEHVEDCFGFLRQAKQKGHWKIYHIPLDISCSAALRDSFMNAWRSVGHIHVFTKSLALETLRATGHEIIDYFYTPGALSVGRGWRAFLGNFPRRILPEGVSVRLLGGYSLMVLAK
jgi:SAM-dependent methyltransferase